MRVGAENMDLKVNKFFYKPFGLNIESHFLLPHASESAFDGDVDIKISINSQFTAEKINWYHHIEEDNQLWCEYGEANDFFICHIPNIADFYLNKNLKEIIISNMNAPLASVESLLMNQVIPLWLQLSGELVLHASAVCDKKGRAYVFVAPSGSGKSTIAHYLVTQGFMLISDDAVWVRPSLDGYEAQSSFSEIRLNDNGEVTSHLKKITNTHCGKVRLSVGEMFALSSSKIKQVFLLDSRPPLCGHPSNMSQETQSIWPQILDNIYRIDVSGQKAANELSQLTDFLLKVPVCKLSYLKNQESLERIARSIK